MKTAEATLAQNLTASDVLGSDYCTHVQYANATPELTLAEERELSVWLLEQQDAEEENGPEEEPEPHRYDSELDAELGAPLSAGGL
jgi:hypothetical protein